MKTKLLLSTISVLFLVIFTQLPAALPFFCPDLVITKFTMSPKNPTTGDNIKFVATVKNIGKIKAGPSLLAIRLGGETNPRTFSIPVLLPYAARTVTMIRRLNVPQNYRATAYADYKNRVKRECSERNNTKYIKFKVTGCPDLVITKLTMSPKNPTTGDNINFKATVKNIGTSKSVPSILATKVRGDNHQRQFGIPGLIPTATRSVSMIRRLNVAGNYYINVWADFLDKVKGECNERNNTRSIRFKVHDTCSGLPDLIITSFSVHPQSPIAGTKVKICASVKNIGGAATTKSSRLCLHIGVRYWVMTIPPLAPNQSVVKCNESWFHEPRNYNCQALADCGPRIKECNENNNKKIMRFTVREKSPQ